MDKVCKNQREHRHHQAIENEDSSFYCRQCHHQARVLHQSFHKSAILARPSFTKIQEPG